jgi:DNA-directed RNA polymerase subunit RPC12/RpoP
MGNFSDNLRKKFAGQNRGLQKNIEFECSNCLNLFNFIYEDIFFNSSGDIQFDPEPACPRCGSTVDIAFSDYGQEKIEDMLFSGQIRKVK